MEAGSCASRATAATRGEVCSTRSRGASLRVDVETKGTGMDGGSNRGSLAHPAMLNIAKLKPTVLTIMPNQPPYHASAFFVEYG